jgi:hypothetical protein
MKPIDNTSKKDKIANALSKNLSIATNDTSLQTVDHLQDDYESSRETYKSLIAKGNDAIEVMMELAKDSQHPRAFEVLATLLKTQSDNNDKLLELQKRVRDLRNAKGQQPSNGTATVTNNNVFVGSTTDLQRFILDQQQNKNKVIDVGNTIPKSTDA